MASPRSCTQLCFFSTIIQLQEQRIFDQCIFSSEFFAVFTLTFSLQHIVKEVVFYSTFDIQHVLGLSGCFKHTRTAHQGSQGDKNYLNIMWLNATNPNGSGAQSITRKVSQRCGKSVGQERNTGQEQCLGLNTWRTGRFSVSTVEAIERLLSDYIRKWFGVPQFFIYRSEKATLTFISVTEIIQSHQGQTSHDAKRQLRLKDRGAQVEVHTGSGGP